MFVQYLICTYITRYKSFTSFNHNFYIAVELVVEDGWVRVSNYVNQFKRKMKKKMHLNYHTKEIECRTLQFSNNNN